MTKIALDAGHGLRTAGKQTPDGIKEWTLNDKVRDRVLAILNDYDVDVINTDRNEGETDEALNDRLSAYMTADVDAFVSIHHNAYTGKWNSATGVSVYTDRSYTKRDQELANAIYTRMVANTGLKGRGIKRSNFVVINQNKIPAVLCEGGFMDGTNDYKYITTAAGQQAYAKAVAEGLIEFLGLKKKVATQQTASGALYRVQTGAFRNKQNAVNRYKAVKAAGFSVCMVYVSGLYKVQVGAYSKKSNADKMAAKLKTAGFDSYITTKGGTAVPV
jgi:N-acetylmuramoyl-L-alanine amidase